MNRAPSKERWACAGARLAAVWSHLFLKYPKASIEMRSPARRCYARSPSGRGGIHRSFFIKMDGVVVWSGDFERDRRLFGTLWHETWVRWIAPLPRFPRGTRSMLREGRPT